MFPKHLFKAYDIRGLAPRELTPDIAERVGQALVVFTAAKNIVVGRDARLTSPKLFQALLRGVAKQGANVIDLGLVTTPMFYFATGQRHLPGAMITASHNPKEYNGIKLCQADVMPIGQASGLKEIMRLAQSNLTSSTNRGSRTSADVSTEYLNKVFSLIDHKKIRKFKVVVDAGNGMAGVILEKFFARLPQIEVVSLFWKVDGQFPNHQANPVISVTLNTLRETVVREQADLGLAFDGDADRIGFVDELGNIISGDIITALLGVQLLKKIPGQTILYDVSSSQVVPEAITAAGGRPVLARVGHGFIKPQMQKEQALFAGELSDHYYFKDMANAESTDLTMLLIFEILSSTKKTFSKLVQPWRRYFHSGNINLPVVNSKHILQAVLKNYQAAASNVNQLDGLRLEFFNNKSKRFWFSLRASNTEPILRLTLEATTAKILLDQKTKLINFINAQT